MKKKGYELTFASISDQGERSHNEDAVGAWDNPDGKALYVLCDGAGGHRYGEKASRLVVNCLTSCYENFDYDLERCIKFAQQNLIEVQEEMGDMSALKTTLVCLEVSDAGIRFAHVGDSRGYYFSKGKYKQHTLDHSVPQALVRMGQIKEKEIRFHSDRSRLLRIMGGDDDAARYDFTTLPNPDANTSYLLCSDGFWEWITETEMEAALKVSDTPENWLYRMRDIVLSHGKGKGMDNYSALAVFARKKKSA